MNKDILFKGMEIFKRRQMALMTVLAICLFIVVVFLCVLLFSNVFETTSSTPLKSYKAPITSGSSRIDPKEIWVEKFTAEQDLNTKRIDNIEKMIGTVMKMIQGSGEEYKSEMNASSQPHVSKSGGDSLQMSTQKYTTTAQELREDIKSTMQSEFVTSVQGTTSPGISSSVPSGAQSRGPQDSTTPIQPSSQTSFEKKGDQRRPHTKGIQRISLNLMNGKGNKHLKTNDNTIPAGAFAQAALLGGVDASTSIQSSNDPRPVLLRITNVGTLPRKFKSDLCDCHALAACYGDISSERVYMRLEKLTCMERKTGEILEMNVTGYVAGEDGRAGLRGTVVDRSGESARNAAVGGFLSGIGNFLSQSPNPVTYSLSSGLAQSNPLTNGDLLKHGAAKGASNALEKYADFYIKRAEQMQPVIQVQAGRVVDIVFTQGVAFEDSAARGALIRSNDQDRYAQIQANGEKPSKPLEAWVPHKGD